MRSQALSVVRRILKGHLGEAIADGYGEADNALYDQLISSMQVQLATRFNWTFLKDDWDLDVSAGTRYLDIPTTTVTGIDDAPNMDNLLRVATKYSGIWQDVEQGICNEDYNVSDPDKNDQMDPIMKWRPVGNRIEIWPVPSTSSILRLTGYRVPSPVIADDDLVVLDGELVALYVAAERLAKADSKDASAKFRDAELRMMELRGAIVQRSGIRMGYRKEDPRKYRDVVPITVAKGQ